MKQKTVDRVIYEGLKEHLEGRNGAIIDLKQENARLQRRVEALELLIAGECDPRDMADEANAMLVQTARDAIARRAAEAFGNEQTGDGK